MSEVHRGSANPKAVRADHRTRPRRGRSPLRPDPAGRLPGVPAGDQRRAAGERSFRLLRALGTEEGQAARPLRRRPRGPRRWRLLDVVTANSERPRGMRPDCLFIGEGETAMNFGKVVLACAGDDAGQVFYRPDTNDDKP